MTGLDQLVVVGYFIAMLAIGWWAARSTRSTDDYLLGGRRMNPILVGLSLFATLVSSLTYLALPDEVIGRGPMLYFQCVAYPLIVLIVGWGMIPYIMRQPVTSAYELLEKRLGRTVRFCAASLFLLLRLGWMAAILYVTCSTLVVRLFGLEDTVYVVPGLGIETSAVPWLCLVMGAITVVYSASGGIKAVVWTDATQSIIMLIGAIGTVIVVTSRIGFDAWWPTEWYAHWDPPMLVSRSGRSFLGCAASVLCWYVATAGADQMAIQRYLSTRDARTARRTLMVSLSTEVVVFGVLTLVGLSVLGYYRFLDPTLTDNPDLWKIASQFFPRFILQELPSGLRGMVVVAVLAAAMSSFSSGINSASAVLKQDILPRFAIFKGLLSRPLLLVRVTSFAIGFIAILLSLALPLVPGNILELNFKIVNVLAVPIFVLFFLALFVPWATPAGALIGLAASIAAAVSVTHFQVYDLAMFWMTPTAMIVGTVVGTLASAVTWPFHVATDEPQRGESE